MSPATCAIVPVAAALGGATTERYDAGRVEYVLLERLITCGLYRARGDSTRLTNGRLAALKDGWRPEAPRPSA